jgi:hypothetical protein
MPTERINQRFVDPGSWVTDGALERENSPVAALSQIGRRAFPANGMPVAFTLSAHRGDRYDGRQQRANCAPVKQWPASYDGSWARFRDGAGNRRSAGCRRPHHGLAR